MPPLDALHPDLSGGLFGVPDMPEVKVEEDRIGDETI